MTSVSVTFVQPSGLQQTVAGQVDDTVMQLATWGSVSGILADCGGAMTCATCHIMIDEGWWDRVGPPSDDEASTMEMAVDVGPRSRLACQVKLTEAMNGLVVQVPKSQF